MEKYGTFSRYCVCPLNAVCPQHWAIRMPNFVKVDSKPFHPDTYVGPEHEDDDVHHNESVREKSMSIKLKVENTMRWRWTKDEFGQDVSCVNSNCTGDEH